MGSTYVAIQRGIPAMAFWSGNSPPMPYSWVNASTKVGLQDPATVTARLASSLVQSFIDKAAGSRVLPRGYGVAVNLPYITSYTSEECTNPPFVLASQPEDDTVVKAAYNTKTGLFTQVLGLDGDQPDSFGFVGQRTAVSPTCLSSVIIFAVNYDAARTRECFSVPNATAIIPVIVHSNGSTPVVGGLGPNASVTSNHSHPTPTPLTSSPPPTATTVTSMGMDAHWSLSALVLGLGIAMLMI
jgi:5'-nucleotidase